MISRVSTSTKVEKLRPNTQCWKHHQTLVPSKPYALLHAKENIQKQLSKFCWVSRWMCVRFGSFFRHLWNISSNDYLKWFSTGKPKGQEKIHPQAISRCGMCFTKKHKDNKYVINIWLIFLVWKINSFIKVDSLKSMKMWNSKYRYTTEK